MKKIKISKHNRTKWWWQDALIFFSNTQEVVYLCNTRSLTTNRIYLPNKNMNIYYTIDREHTH